MRSEVASLVVWREFYRAARLAAGAFTLLVIPCKLYALSFVQQPQGGTRYPGDGFLLSCIVTDSPTPTYQWYQDGNLRTGATNSQLFLTNLAFTNAGNYTVVASSGTDSVTSAPAALVVLSDADITGSIQDIRHVVVFMQENRSFDEYFGTLKGGSGFNDRNALVLRTGDSVFFQTNGNHYVLPYHFATQCLNDVEHDWGDEHQAWHSGKWDRWISAKGTGAMAYYNRNDLAYYYALAGAYTVCDAYHCSVMGPTSPNRLYLMTGMLDPNNTGGGPLIDNDLPSAGFSWTTYPERLQAAGVSWKVYQQGTDYYSLNALRWFSQYMNATPGNPLYDRGMVLVGNLVSTFQADVSNGTLPRVSWIIPPWSRSEHPPYSPANGEILTKQLLDALASNPAVYNSTVFIFTYDEAGGFFDHVPPPVPSAGTPSEFVNGLPIGLGVRVPTILVSPWTRGGYTCSQVFDHTSVIRFLETWTGVHEPNISAWRRQACGDLTSACNFANPNTNYPSLPTTTPINCFFGIDPTVPSPQTVPVQEAGMVPGRPLPYQPNASSTTDCGSSRFWITMTNAGAESVQFAIYPNAYRSDGPWQYDVGASNTVSDDFSVGSSGGRYDLTCYGPNGFQRRFAGNINSNCNQVEVFSSIDTNVGGIALSMQNLTDTAISFTVTNSYPTGGPWTYNVPAGSTVTNAFPAIVNNYGWYDLAVTASHDPLFLRRFSGHVETDGKDFLLTVTPDTQTVATVSDAAYTVTVTAINGFNGDVTLSVTGLPTDVSANCSPATVAGSGTATISMTTSANTVTGSYLVTVTAASSNTFHSTVIALTINPPDFSVTVTPNTQTATIGSNAAFLVTVGATNGFTGDVALSATGLPSDVSADFSPPSVTDSGTSALSLTISTNTPPGTYPLTITGASSNATRACVVSMTIVVPDFSLAVTPNAESVTAGSNAVFTVGVGATNGFTGDVMLSVTGLPTDVSVDFSPPSVAGSGTSTLSLTIPTNTPPGSYPLTVTGSSNTTHTAMVTLTINPLETVIPDWWALQYFNCTNCPQADRTADPDGDGMNNLAEFLAGTDPTNGASAFRIVAVMPQGNDVLVTWQGGGNRTNALQTTLDPSGSYVDVSSNITLSGTGDQTTNFLDVGAATNTIRFYRARLVP